MPTEEGERKSTISLLSGLSGMKIYRLEKKVILKSDMDTVWDFFSSPLNLNEITPPDMSFEILTDVEGVKMYPGMIIQYKVRTRFNRLLL